MPSKKAILVILYCLVLLTPIVTWAQGYHPQGGLYEYLRLAGLLAFTLIFAQLVIGAFMVKLRPIFGTKLLRLHIWQGVIAFTLAWTHPLLYTFQFGITRVLKLGGYYTFGKVGLALLTLAVLAGLLRTRPFLQAHWRWVHRLNYVTLLVIYIHSWNVGSDTHVFPMLLLYWLAPLVWVGAIYHKLRPIVYNLAYGNK